MKEYIEALKAGAVLTSGISIPLVMSGVGINWQIDMAVSSLLIGVNYILLFGNLNKD